jgi:hypothetical protein
MQNAMEWNGRRILVMMMRMMRVSGEEREDNLLIRLPS